MRSDGNYATQSFGEPEHLTHKRLRGGRQNDGETECPGSHALLRPNLLLGFETRTDLFELQLRNSVERPISKKGAYSLGIALREALSQVLGVETAELGCAVRPTRDLADNNTFSIFLYDTASDGAGYATQAFARGPEELFKKALEVLQCQKHCETACHACLLSFDTQFHISDLDRNEALAILDDHFIRALSLPIELQAFGPTTVMEMESLRLAISRETLRLGTISMLRIYLGGLPIHWVPLEWSLKEELFGLRSRGVNIQLMLDAHEIEQLSPDQKDELRALISVIGAEAMVSNERDTLNSPSMIMAMAHAQGQIRWASSNRDSLSPNASWGSSEIETLFVRTSSHEPLAEPGSNYTHLRLENLRVIDANATDIPILDELNGSIQSFGARAWSLIAERTPRLAKLLNSDIPLTEVNYSDRYLKSPDAALFLRSFLQGVCQYTGGVGTKTKVIVRTAKPDLRDNGFEPRFIDQNWKDSLDRKDVLESLLGPDACKYHYLELQNSELPHARILTLTWGNNETWRMRLDQGFGYWRSATREYFPFERGATFQMQKLREMSFSVVPHTVSRHPTYISIVRINE
jgi:DEAD/DEAH box helicase domain-containing protein